MSYGFLAGGFSESVRTSTDASPYGDRTGSP
jgi:hypothetical protein